MTEKPFRRLPSYAGPITPQQAAQGIQAAVQNARSLLADAELLCEHSRWPRVASLSILAAEEIGKVSLLREILVAETPEQLREMWRDYRRHTEKNWLGVFLSCVSEAPNIEDFRELADPESDHRQLLEALKQLGLYSDCLGQCHWCLPDRAIDEQEARVLLRNAECLVPKGESAMQTPAELQLWIKHMRPVQGKGMLAMKEALIACYDEAQELGVLRGNSSVEDMVRFLL